MGKHGPKRGSRSFWHRKRAVSIVPRARFWNKETPGLTGFVGFKAGMVRVTFVDDSASPMTGQSITAPATIVEVPPIFIYSVTAIKALDTGPQPAVTITATGAPKYSDRALTLAKKPKHTLEQLGSKLAEYTELRVLALTQPSKSGLGNKTPEPIELALGGTIQEQFDFIKEHLGKEIHASKVFGAGDYIDAIAVTTGRGWQGLVKRMGVALNPHKATKSRRHGGSIGGERQAKVMYTIPRAGQHGFHRRTDLAKRILMIGESKAATFIPKGGLKRYGPLSSEFVILRGSIPGPIKRLVSLRKSVRPGIIKAPPQIVFEV